MFPKLLERKIFEDDLDSFGDRFVGNARAFPEWLYLCGLCVRVCLFSLDAFPGFQCCRSSHPSPPQEV